ncbi:MAG: TonB-dependent receptor [Bacteroidales bacterium]|nr:TonB-dependent receptor [Bacteroidales bacterium]
MKKLILVCNLLLLALAASAQTGGIRAGVVDRMGRTPIAGASVELFRAGEKIAGQTTGEDGSFLFEKLEDGPYTLEVKNPEFNDAILHVNVEKGTIRDLVCVTMTLRNTMEEPDPVMFVDLDMTDAGYSDSPTILFGANDVYNNIAGYGFSSVRFKNRGYNSETQDVYLAGVKMNDALTGYSPFSLWSGLNEAMRSKESTVGLEPADYGVGGYNGTTNIAALPSSVRPGWRFSVLTNSALYRLRLMTNYASGVLDNGWSFAVNASARLGGNDWIKGVYYRSFALYAGAEKQFGDEHRLAFFAFATPGERGAQNASTQEVYDLMGDNMYNSNWGYQNGKVRNSRVRKTFEPVVGLKYEFTPSTDLNVAATLLWRTGWNGYTAIDFYDAMDPRPDYYRNLPSYFYMDDSDYNRENPEKAAWATEMWSQHIPAYYNYQHLNWDRLYNVNYNNADRRSKYALEERHVDQNDINMALTAKWRINDLISLSGGMTGKINRTENYKKIDDLLGGQYYLNVDQFAERDFASNEAFIQNDLDYFFANGTAEKIQTGGRYGYDYLAQVRKLGAWASGRFQLDNFTVTAAMTAGYEAMWREGRMRKGLFAGLDDDGNEIWYQGTKLTAYDAKGRVISSKGKSEVAQFFTCAFKAGAEYAWRGGHRIAANVGIFSDAPTFKQAFISARTRNTLVDGLKNTETASADLTYQFTRSGYNVRLTGFYTGIWNQTDVISFYDDSQQSFTNFAMTNINQRHMGIELGVKVPLFVQGLSLSGVLSLGEYIYTSTPHVVQTIDNSSEIVRDEDVTYWQRTPVFKSYINESGRKEYERDLDGNFVVDHYQKHYIPSTPQLASQIALNYRTRSYWFFEINGQYMQNSYLSMNPLYRTESANKGSESNPEIIEYMTAQEKFDPAFLLNASMGKSWYIKRKYSIGFSMEVKNILNNRDVKTGGYEQTRLISSDKKDRYYKFYPKYFYMCGANYMLNIYFRF